MAQFSVANGQIIDPNGNQFVARGINTFLNQVDSSTILKTFPGINAVRLATTPGADQNAIDALVQGLTSKGVVVLIEDHSSSGGNPNTSSGQALANEASWYAGLAGKYQANPYVWFGTANEPDNTGNLQAIPVQEKAIYDAIRGTGSNAMVMMEMRGGFTNDAAQQNASYYAGMKNVAWDTHYYGWVVNQSTDPATIAKGLQNQIADAQSVKSADGTMPVVIGEYGPSTSGIAGYDANGLQVVQAVDDSGYGTFAWAWSAGTDTLTNGNGLTDFGQMVAKHIAAGASMPAPPVVIPPVVPPVTIPTPPVSQGNYITPGKGSFTDAAGNVYALDAMGNADENGNPVADGSNTAAMEYANGQVYGQDAASHSWYTWDQTSWTAASAPPAPTPTPPPVVVPPVVVPPVVVPGAPPAAPATDTLQLSLSEDAWQGDAQAFVTVDGKQVGGMLTVTAAHAQGKAQTISLTGSWGPGAHDVGVQFVNDAYGGTATTDRNLYVNKLTLDGQASAAPPATLYSNGTAHLATAASPLVLQLSEDAWQGDAQFTVAVDGKTLGAAQAVTALHAKGAVQDFAFGTAMAAGTHDVAVSFLNDAYGGTAATDRNLYVSAVDANGKAMAGTTATLLSTATQHFAVVVAAHV